MVCVLGKERETTFYLLSVRNLLQFNEAQYSVKKVGYLLHIFG